MAISNKTEQLLLNKDGLNVQIGRMLTRGFKHQNNDKDPEGEDLRNITVAAYILADKISEKVKDLKESRELDSAESLFLAEKLLGSSYPQIDELVEDKSKVYNVTGFRADGTFDPKSMAAITFKYVLDGKTPEEAVELAAKDYTPPAPTTISPPTGKMTPKTKAVTELQASSAKDKVELFFAMFPEFKTLLTSYTDPVVENLKSAGIIDNSGNYLPEFSQLEAYPILKVVKTFQENDAAIKNAPNSEAKTQLILKAFRSLPETLAADPEYKKLFDNAKKSLLSKPGITAEDSARINTAFAKINAYLEPDAMKKQLDRDIPVDTYGTPLLTTELASAFKSKIDEATTINPEAFKNLYALYREFYLHPEKAVGFFDAGKDRVHGKEKIQGMLSPTLVKYLTEEHGVDEAAALVAANDISEGFAEWVQRPDVQAFVENGNPDDQNAFDPLVSRLIETTRGKLQGHMANLGQLGSLDAIDALLGTNGNQKAHDAQVSVRTVAIQLLAGTKPGDNLLNNKARIKYAIKALETHGSVTSDSINQGIESMELSEESEGFLRNAALRAKANTYDTGFGAIGNGGGFWGFLKGVGSGIGEILMRVFNSIWTFVSTWWSTGSFSQACTAVGALWNGENREEGRRNAFNDNLRLQIMSASPAQLHLPPGMTREEYANLAIVRIGEASAGLTPTALSWGESLELSHKRQGITDPTMPNARPEEGPGVPAEGNNRGAGGPAPNPALDEPPAPTPPAAPPAPRTPGASSSGGRETEVYVMVDSRFRGPTGPGHTSLDHDVIEKIRTMGGKYFEWRADTNGDHQIDANEVVAINQSVAQNKVDQRKNHSFVMASIPAR